MAAMAVEKRSLGVIGRMGIVAAMHLVVLLVLARSFGIMPAAKLPSDIDMVPVEEPLPADPPPPPLPDYKPQKDDVVLAEPEPVPFEPDATDGGITAKFVPIERLPTDTGSAQVIPPAVFNVRADPKHPLTQPPYPPSRIRANDEGAVDLEIYVLPNGRVGDARVLKSSGFEDFDRAALQEARRNWRLSPATRDGEPFAQWYALRVVFKLKNAP